MEDKFRNDCTAAIDLFLKHHEIRKKVQEKSHELQTEYEMDDIMELTEDHAERTYKMFNELSDLEQQETSINQALVQSLENIKRFLKLIGKPFAFQYKGSNLTQGKFIFKINEGSVLIESQSNLP